MLVILSESGTKSSSHHIAAQIESALNIDDLMVLEAASTTPWGPEPKWDDLLLVVFRSEQMPQSAIDFICEYRSKRPAIGPGGSSQPGGFIIPIAVDPGSPKPPVPIDGLMALVYDQSSTADERLVRRVRVFLGRPSASAIT